MVSLHMLRKTRRATSSVSGVTAKWSQLKASARHKNVGNDRQDEVVGGGHSRQAQRGCTHLL
jgi:hypothetical protein